MFVHFSDMVLFKLWVYISFTSKTGRYKAMQEKIKEQIVEELSKIDSPQLLGNLLKLIQEYNKYYS